tara:strand:- start:711 stop:920 length:210 start_codon:yes stop_codon:yes gene_type:complete
MSSQEIHNITTVINALVGIKWALICIAVSLWGLTVFFLFKEIPKWWQSFDKNKNNLYKLPPEGSEGGHY